MAYCLWDNKCRLYAYHAGTGEYVFHLSKGGGEHEKEVYMSLGEALSRIKELRANKSNRIPASAVEKMEEEYQASLVEMNQE